MSADIRFPSVMDDPLSCALLFMEAKCLFRFFFFSGVCQGLTLKTKELKG